MWYEIIPAGGIIFVALAFPHFSAYAINKLTLGNMYRRRLIEREEFRSYMRDMRLTGNPYKQQGLDAIGD